jgi:Tfp pilus assembly protein PilN
MLIDIDFLPASYQQRRERGRKRVWRRGVFLVLLGLLMLGGLKQRQTRLELVRERDELRRRGADMLAQLGSADALRSQVRALDTRAELIGRLSVRTPPTRLLAEIAAALPEFVTLTEVRLGHERLATNVSTTAENNGSPPAEPSPVEKDVAQLREQAETQAIVVTVHGVAPDDLAVSKYLAALQETGSFDEVRLQFADQHTYRDHPLRSFAVQLRVRPIGRMPPRMASRVGVLTAESLFAAMN